MKQQNDFTNVFKWLKAGKNPVTLIGFSGSARAYFLSRLMDKVNRPCLVILPQGKDAEPIYRDLRFFLSASDEQGRATHARLGRFPAYDLTPLTGLSPQREVVTQRLRALFSLSSDPHPFILTSLEALSFRVLPKRALIDALDYFEAGEELDRDRLLRKLEMTGYQRTSLVEETGDYAVRGGVLDIFCPLYRSPVRLEFWGDHVESIRTFDPVSQRSQKPVKAFTLIPANEILTAHEHIKRARSMGRMPGHIEKGMRFPGKEAWLNHFYPKTDTVFDYLPDSCLIIHFDPHRLETICKKIEKNHLENVTRFRGEAAKKGMPFPEIDGLFVPSREMIEQTHKRQRLRMSELDLETHGRDEHLVRLRAPFQSHEDLEIRMAGKGRVSLAPLAQKISGLLQSRNRVVLVSRNERQAERLKDILSHYDIAADHMATSWAKVPQTPGLSICTGRLGKGFAWPDLGLHVISEDEIFGPKKDRTRSRRPENALKWSSFSQLKKGDFLVHEEHGIGRYGGLKKMDIHNNINDFILIEYAQNDRLYIPADRISMLQKYSGLNEMEPKLDRLGGHSWDLVKQRAKNSVKRIAKQLVQIYALRKYRKGYAFAPPDPYFREFEATFEHEETPDQIKTIEDVLHDMTSEKPMDRLLCGDVGFGKTEVAVRAAFKAVSDGKQVALLVPTTVLAEQHFETFQNRMKPYGFHLGVLSRFKTRKEQLETLAKLRSGLIDIIIGTHRLLQKDVQFQNLGLLVIDEEQRFGVKQKEALKKYRTVVDVLALTATPIPRTFQMSLMGVRDLSIIETPPRQRHAIETYLSPYDEPLIVRAIGAELDRGGQVFFVHNRVLTLAPLADQLAALLPQARFAVAHGQMKEKDLEKTMVRFLRKDIDVLVCTTIIESGLDIPSANTIIINQVDRLGLSEIYQLRGRVGRGKEKAYAYLLLSDGAILSRDAEKRLKALMDFTQLGAGLHLAMHDLKIRGAGNILGYSQAGHITALGYELYLKLIEKAVAELKGEERVEDINPEINMDLPAYLPETYVTDTDVRLNLYRRLSGLQKQRHLKAMVEEIKDRFGPPPEEVQNVLSLMSIRILLKKMGIHRLDVGSAGMTLTLSENSRLDPEKTVSLVSKKPNKFRFLSAHKLYVNLGVPWHARKPSTVKEALRALEHTLRQNP